METSLKSLIAKRGGLKAQLTLFETFLNDLCNKQPTDKDLLMLEKRLCKIESLLDLFIEVNTEITCLQETEESTVELGSFQDKYFNAVANANTLLIKYKPVDNQSTSGSSRSNDLNESRNINKVKLPEISLPSYDGTFTQWREFKDKFGSLIDKDDTLTNAQKLSYLKSTLKGEAAELISALETTNDNYAIAMGRLEKKYNNKRRIVNNHVQSILDIGNITRESHQSLRNLINTTQNHLDCLKTFTVPVDSWDALLIPILASKLDSQTNKEWEAKLNKEKDTKDRIPTVVEFLDFLSVKQSTLETTHNRITNKGDQINKVNKNMREIKALAAVTVSCDNCQQEHLLQDCEEFLKLNNTDRNSKIRELKVCINCLRKGHFVQNCRSTNSCRKCRRRHHTLLHIATSQAEQRGEQTIANCINNEPSPSHVLLSTAKVLALDKLSQPQEIRVLLDSASQSNFITARMCKQLQLKPEQINISVKGINNGSSVINQRVRIKIQSNHNNFNTVLTCLVIPEITPNLPTQSLRVESFKVPPHIKLADPTFWKSGPIDLLIGANLFYELLCVGQIKKENSPVLQKTKLGWVLSGGCAQSNTSTANVSQSVTYLTLNELHKSVEKFWNADEFESKERKLSIEEQYCEDKFKDTTTRDSTGKFIVRLPLRDNLNQLGDSTATAKSRFYAIERRLNKNVSLKHQYTEFMTEYIKLNHMAKIDNTAESGFYLPHHPVMNNMSETTKLRVVFDGSCNLDNGLPINEVQCVGPTIQEELVAIIARFRTYTYVITADITKMYRQVWVHTNDRKYQRIFWRFDVNEELQSYELKTVTYGTSAAPYLAIRALIQLSIDNAIIYPTEARIIRHDFYVDDLLTGSDSVEELEKIKSNVSDILNTGGFTLRQWVSNVSKLSDEQKERVSSVPLTEKIHKTLGIYWNWNTDTFSYSTMQIKAQPQVTKRTILAATSQLFDPLGLLSPIIMLARLIIQDLWKGNVDWDESVPRDIYSRWLTFRDQLKFIDKIQIPRHAILHQSQAIELHAFSDASERGYGACIYLRSTNAIGETKVCLLAAKSRVTPTKFVTVPRLELCAAVLSAQLVTKFKPSLNVLITKEYFWCDSQVVLGWINSQANKYNTYVANRITEIQSLTSSKNWYHVKSKENPVDLISRGVLPIQLINLSLWWHGPFWLCEPINQLNDDEVDVQADLPEQKKNVQVFAITTFEDPFLIKNHSSLPKLTRTVAYTLRFIQNCSVKLKDRIRGPLTASELRGALIQLVKITQRECFATEISNLTNKVPIGNKSKILSLSPFIDCTELLRVGGRLQLSEFTYDKRHPILLPKNHHLTVLIFRNEHISLLHAGARLLLSTIREKFWPINGVNIAKKTVRESMKCVRFQKQVNNQLMGNLPRERILKMYPFHSTGVDYGGPFLIKDRKGRGSKVSKAYLCLFICMSTKSIHLELVSELSTTAFLASLRRFIARRGKPLHIFSDNGTNFVGANRELGILGNFLQEQSDNIQTKSAELGIQWHFIPPYAPNFGGLWEAGIKSTKHYLKRVLNETPLTYEEFSTLLCQIESILNSRPLTPLTTDPSDLEVLTPAHFLIGRQFTTIPDSNVRDLPMTRLNRFEHIQKMTQIFWHHWSKHYIAELQQRQRWKRASPPLRIGTMVLVKQDNVPPARWQLGRVTAVHPGRDEIVRVVTVKCGSGEIKRSLAKIVVLPISDGEANA